MPSVVHPPFPAYQGTDPYIFVSYSHRDGNLVFLEIERLHRLGYRIWYDEGIDPGNEWTEEIAKALEDAAQFLVFISETAVLSTNVRNEINFALNRQKPFLAVHLSHVKLPRGLELRMADLQAVYKWRMPDEHYHRKIEKALLETTRASGAPRIVATSLVSPEPELSREQVSYPVPVADPDSDSDSDWVWDGESQSWVAPAPIRPFAPVVSSGYDAKPKTNWQAARALALVIAIPLILWLLSQLPINLWNDQHAAPIWEANGYYGVDTNSVAWSPDGKLLAAASNNLALYNAATGQLQGTLAERSSEVFTVAWSPNGRTLASGSGDHLIQLWDVATRTCRATLAGQARAVFSVLWTPDGQTLISGSSTMVKTWDVATQACKTTITFPDGDAQTGKRIFAIALSPDGRKLAVGSSGGLLQFFDVETGTQTAAFTVDFVRNLAWSPDGRTLASTNGRNAILLWDVRTHQNKTLAEDVESPIVNLAWAPDSRTLASCSTGYGYGLRLWDVATGSFQAPSVSPKIVAWSTNGRLIALGEPGLEVWDTTRLLQAH